jgi:hypothetical protein
MGGRMEKAKLLGLRRKEGGRKGRNDGRGSGREIRRVEKV